MTSGFYTVQGLLPHLQLSFQNLLQLVLQSLIPSFSHSWSLYGEALLTLIVS